MKRIEEIERLSLEELEKISEDAGVKIPAKLNDSIEDILCAELRTGMPASPEYSRVLPGYRLWLSWRQRSLRVFDTRESICCRQILSIIRRKPMQRWRGFSE